MLFAYVLLPDYLGGSVLSDNITVVNNCFHSYRESDLILIAINSMQTHIQLLCAFKTIIQTCVHNV